MRGTVRDHEKGMLRTQKGDKGERTALLARVTDAEEDSTTSRRCLKVIRAVMVYTFTLAFLYILWFVDSAGVNNGLQHPSAAGTKAATAGRTNDPAGLTVCQQHLAAVCGDAAPGDACMKCAASNPDVDPRNSDGFFCEQWDITAFCSPGAPAEPLAPIQQEESKEPQDAIDFILDSFAICRMYACAIGPSYLILLRAGFTALVLAWLSVLPQPIGSGEPSVPGALAVATGLLLVARSFYSSVTILFIAPAPSFAESWYLWYEIKWYVALQHPSFGQAVSVVLHKFYGWISTELAWRRKVADYKRIQEGQVRELQRERKAKVKVAAEVKGAKQSGKVQTQQRARANVQVQQQRALRPPQTREQEKSPVSSGGKAAEEASPVAAVSPAAEGGMESRAPAPRPASPLPAAPSLDPSSKESPRQLQPRQAPPRLNRPPQPPDIARVIFDVAEALKSPPEAALGTAATIALQVSLSLALLNMAIVVLPLTLTHLVPAVVLLPPTVLIGICHLDWWRAVSLTLLFSVLAALFIITAGFIIAFLKQRAVWCVARHEVIEKDSREAHTIISGWLARLGVTGLHPHHPIMFAARAVFVKVLSLVAALVVIGLQEATARVILLRQRDSTRFLACTAVMLIVCLLLSCTVGCSRHQRWIVYVLWIAAVAVCTLALTPLQRFPAEVFDARTTCAYIECSMHHFHQGLVGKINNYCELMPFITDLVHHMSPVHCFDTIEYAPPNWGAVGLVVLGILLLAAVGYVIKRIVFFFIGGPDNTLVQAMAGIPAGFHDKVRELSAKYPNVDPAIVAAVVKTRPDNNAEQVSKLSEVSQVDGVEQLDEGGVQELVEQIILARPKIYGSGRNDNGQLGVHTTGKEDRYRVRLSPVPAAGLQPPQGVEIAEVCCGADFVLLRTLRGDVLHAGSNSHGERGDGGTDWEPHPELSRVPLAAAAVSLAAGANHAAAVLNDRSVHTWGTNGYKQLGRG
eukprot:TRINITY_DN5129_c0_g2_i1.p1 TRINITY_DN5129_c0_g2~~TRINITY_DN5129_c0_g2_i1.p1  ORF type:complete len:1014 (+),score=194.80 TRINITY_DN5129_c0_g2_i1:122-3043(+)